MGKYDINIQNFEEINNINLAIIIVGHNFYREIGLDKFLEKMGSQKLIMDIPNLFVDSIKKYPNIHYWSL